MSFIEKLSSEQLDATRERRLTAMHLQKIEDNPLDADDVAMFEMFEREGWPHERCRDYIIAHAQNYTTDDTIAYAAE